MDRSSLFFGFVIGLVIGGSAVTGYMYLSSDSPLMVRQKAFEDTATNLLNLSKQLNKN